MLNELLALESRVTEVVALCHALRAENDGLKDQLAAAQAEKHQLVERMGEARSRLERITAQLPEAKT
ncbi:hypothetical protein [Accumulibacter sp.]|uniref:hypothetical protein n=1 Tax=Accumulibacter sp. TaxID=2053492 RepID=UPI00287A360C|nr:hypothetical protein [Accumulibacter sp.]MDS4056078.1 hypothetical protein [Accumulibacter sp.]HMW78731.1 hypothetical protein [Accumulibacter sp.]HMX69092.1 hypothetical protein [Accumulibacter sp.]HNB67914.1 hypothetical protein [Accumulibacter sp.]HNC27120.1 hypothetical protein [Accumulibacter sp.]